MENNITAEEFWRQSDTDDPVKNMIEFAKLKCQEQLEAILKKGKLNTPDRYGRSTREVYYGEDGDVFIDKDSIINAYDLNNIK
jgi:hypothetical protein